MNGFWVEVEGMCRVSGDVHMNYNWEYEVKNFKCEIRIGKTWIPADISDEFAISYLETLLIGEYRIEEAERPVVDSPFALELVETKNIYSPFKKDIFSGKRK